MSAPNFKMMDKFPLLVAEDIYEKVCPKCNLGQDNENEKCEDCGCDLTDVTPVYADWLMQDTISEMESFAKKINEKQSLFEVVVESGYYTGVQFFVNEKYGDVSNWTNDDFQYEFGECRSKMLRKFKTTENMVRRELLKAKKELGMIELSCIGIFSNGEAVYNKVA